MTELDDKAKDFLKERRFAVVATINKDGTPQQTVLWYELQEDRIMMNTAAGRLKEKNLRRDPRISFCIEDEYEYLTITGRVTLDYDHERTQADIHRLAVLYEGEEKAERMSQNTFGKQQRVSIYLPLDQIDSVISGVSGVRKEATNTSS